MQKYSPLYTKTLNAEQRDEASASLMFLVKNRDGRIKARCCTYGSKQRIRPDYKKEDGASPTVSNEGLMITSVIEEHEKHNVACIDIPGAYLHMLTDEY